jgi:arsenite-transporting ATPase
MAFLEAPTPNLFFTGKGGVGKTTASCATAVRLAGKGRRVLLISTDPASNLDEVFGVKIGMTPTSVPEVEGLSALNLDPAAAAAAYRERVVGPYRNVLPAAAVASIEEQLSGACTVEIAAFDEFAKLLASPSITERFDHIVFDTAPTGHTLRLLSLPSAWTTFFENAKSDASCLGPLQGLAAQRSVYAAALAALSDPKRTTLVLVSRPDRAALAEAARTSDELSALGIANQEFILNGVFRATAKQDPLARDIERAAATAIEAMPSSLARLSRTTVCLKPRQLLGAPALKAFFDPPAPVAKGGAASPPRLPDLPPLDTLIDSLAERENALVMTLGKGGVGKSTIARLIATGLALRGRDVLLSTTDPAGSFADWRDRPARLSIDRIDPRAEVERYRAEVMATTGAKLDDNGRALLAEDLASPCTEEIAVFRAFAATVDQARSQFVVLDTAPTGHTILLLDAAQSFHREVSRQAKAVPEPVQQLLPCLRDKAFTHMILCTLPEATPVHEAAELQKDLLRAGITPHGWVVNQCLSLIETTDPVLLERKAQEARYIREVMDQHAMRVSFVGWQSDPERKNVSRETRKPSSPLVIS